MEKPTVVSVSRPSLAGNGFQLRTQPTGAPGPAAGPERRVSSLLTVDLQRRMMLNPDKLPEQSASYVQLVNMLTRLELQMSALERVLIRRFVVTEPELMAALAEVHQEYDNELRALVSQMTTRPPPPARPQPDATDPRGAPST